ncbi:hypothetical protein L7F22_012763 [Adiantum nelumboides]|nr:hypothetical protein [Adiantum nelumboides]
MTSSVTRLIIHLTKLGGRAGPCPAIPEAIHEECKANYLPLKTRRGVARASEEVVPPDCDLSDSGDDASPAASVASGAAVSSGGGSSSSSKKKASSQGGRPPKQAKQATLAQVLQNTVVSDEFKEWLDGETTTSQQEATAIQRLCLKEEFWQEVKGLVIAILPLYKVLRMTDMEGSTIGLLHHFMEEASKEIEACTILDGPHDGSRDVLEDTPKRDDILYLVKKRWEWMKRPIHGFAALLHPAYKKTSLFSDQVFNEERMKYLPKVLKEELHGEFLQEVINYGDQRGTAFASSVCWKESLVKPLFWWESFGFQMPHVQRVALSVLGQDCSSGACERNWSTYSLIHTKIRNKLSTKQSEHLIYCRSNLRMLRSMHEMPMARQVNADECKLSIETLKSLNKDRDPEEEQIFRELYMELKEIDRCVSRTRSRKKVVMRGSVTRGRGSSTSAVRGGGRASTRAPTTYVRRGSGSGSSTTATTQENVPLSRSTERSLMMRVTSLVKDIMACLPLMTLLVMKMTLITTSIGRLIQALSLKFQFSLFASCSIYFSVLLLVATM